MTSADTQPLNRSELSTLNRLRDRYVMSNNYLDPFDPRGTTDTISTEPHTVRLSSNRDVKRAVKAISTGQPFDGNSMSGRPFDRLPNPHQYNMRMPDADVQTMTELAQSPGIHYVIYSWVTPIAYRLADNSWVVPDVTYSGFTSRHMSLVWQALRTMGIDTTSNADRPFTLGPRGGKHYGKRAERFYPSSH